MKSFSELTSASQVNNGDLLAISQTSGSGYASKKTTVKDITDKSNLNLAEEYDSTSTYAVDDYVIYESVLYKCIATTTGAFDSTKWTSVVVTDEMGSGGGGGTGGHTIIDENGNSMTARAGLQFVGANVLDDNTNNKTIVDLASAGGIDGVFVDTSNVIQASTPITSSADVSYTATEDCAVLFTVASDSNNSANIKINDVKIWEQYDANGINQFSNYLFVKKGQTIKFHHTFTGGAGTYTVYGIQTGTTHSKFQPVIYSTEEREIGVWKDGKPLYEKTITFSNVSKSGKAYFGIANSDTIFVNNGSITNIGTILPYVHGSVPANNIGGFIDKEQDNSDSYWEFRGGNDAPSTLNGWMNVRYTKTTDVAGSGTWTPQGVPAVHYSTDEQVIGTWMGETLYEKTYVANSEISILTGNQGNDITSLIDNLSSMAQVVNCFATNEIANGFMPLVADNSNNHFVVYTFIGNSFKTLTVQYTKSS